MRKVPTALAVAALFCCTILPAHAQSGGLLGGVAVPVEQVVVDVLDTADDSVGKTVDALSDTLNNAVTGTVGGQPSSGPGEYGFVVPASADDELPDSLIAQLRQLIEIIRAREWAQYGLANARVGAIDLRRWVPEENWGELDGVMLAYAGDITALQQSITAGNVLPGWTGFRRLPVSRVVAFDYEEGEARIVLYFT